jgi:hypothetical protein
MKTPGDELVTALEMLRRRLGSLRERLDDSGVERTFHLRRIMGQDCTSYQRSMNFFTSEDYEDLRERILEISDLFGVIDGR